MTNRTTCTLAATLAVAAACSTSSAIAVTATAAGGVEVTELALTGVAHDSLADLPAVAPPPAEGLSPTATPSGRAQRLDQPAPDPDVLTAQLATKPFSVAGITWDAGTSQDVVIRYRVHESGGWTDWDAVGPTDAGADAASREYHTSRGATDPLVAPHADGIQIWAEAGTGSVTGLKAVLIDPGQDPTVPPASAADSALGPGGGAVTDSLIATSESVVVAAASAPAPAIITRAQWGANEAQVTCQPDLSMTTLAAAVHHTASTNDYSEADVPGLIRGFMEYHTRPEAQGGRGWCDIGYNFLVDKFGRIFEGRAGSIQYPVVGVHTGGFNSTTVGIATIGNYDSASPSPATLESISQLIAWKFRQYRISANAAVTMVSGGGASKYSQGTAVTFSTIYGHRDAQYTSCPGQNLYAALQLIRNRVATLSNDSVAHAPIGSLDVLRAGTSTLRVAGWTLDPDTDASTSVVVSVDSIDTTVPATVARPDVAAAFGLGADHGFDLTLPLDSQQHRVCVGWTNRESGYDVLVGCRRMHSTNRLPFGVIDTVRTTATSITATGWAMDPDTTGAISVHAYLDGTWATATWASNDRPDVAAVYGNGASHGYTLTIPATSGNHTLCLYGIDSDGGPNPVLTCRTATAG